MLLYKLGGGVAIVALLGAVAWWQLERAYNRGVVDTIRTFVEADREGAKDVRKTAEEVLRTIDPNDPIGLLESTGGLRD